MYGNLKDNVMLLVTKPFGSCVFGGQRKCHMHLNMCFVLFFYCIAVILL